MLTTNAFIKATLLFLFLISIGNTLQAQTQQSKPSNTTQEDQRLTDARRENEEAQAAYYREQVAQLRRPSQLKTFWQNVAENPASVLGVLGALLAAFVGLFSLYKNQRLTIASQYDTQFYESLKRFGEKDSARLRSSAVGLLTQMARRSVSKGSFQQRDQSKFFTVLNQLVAGGRLEENIVVLNTITDALKELGSIEPLRTMGVLYKANRDLQNDLKIAIQTYSFHFGETETTETDDSAAWRVSPAVWPTIQQVTGFNSFVLYDWLKHVTNDFQVYDQSARAEVNSMDPKEKSEHKRNALGHVKTTANHLKHNVDACCSTLNNLAQRVAVTNTHLSKRYLSRKFAKLFRGIPRASMSNGRQPLILDEIFLVNGKLTGLNMSSLRETICFQKPFLHEVDLSKSNLTETNLSSARMIGVILGGAKLVAANLSEAILMDAMLEDADLSYASLSKALLWHAHINQESVLNGAQWWTANFFDATLILTEPALAESGSINLEIDMDLLGELFKRGKPDDHSFVHASVTKYKDLREQGSG